MSTTQTFFRTEGGRGQAGFATHHGEHDHGAGRGSSSRGTTRG